MAQDIRKQNAAPAERHPLDAWGSLRGDMDRMFEGFFGGRGLPSLFGASAAGVSPSVEVRENEKEIVIEAELPGMQEKDVQITFRDGVISIKGEKRSERDETKDDVHISERSYGSFQRSFRLPDSVEVEKAVAAFDNGVLKLTLPKTAAAVSREKRIPIGKG